MTSKTSKTSKTSTRKIPATRAKKKRAPWRPTLLSYELADEIARYIEKGFDYKTSYEAAGISKGTFYKYLNKAMEIQDALHTMYEEAGEDEDFEVELDDSQDKHLYFIETISKAKSKAKAANIECLMRNAQPIFDPETGDLRDPGNYKAALEYLRRRDPSEWGDTDKREVTIKADDATTQAINSGVIAIPNTGTGLTRKEMAEYVKERQRESIEKAKEGAGDD